MNRTWWIIEVSDYGEYPFFGTEEEAEDAAMTKAEWEGGEETVREPRASDQSSIDKEIETLKRRHRLDMELEENEMEAIR